jgi:hypothetical protein
MSKSAINQRVRWLSIEQLSAHDCRHFCLRGWHGSGELETGGKMGIVRNAITLYQTSEDCKRTDQVVALNDVHVLYLVPLRSILGMYSSMKMYLFSGLGYMLYQGNYFEVGADGPTERP